MRTPRIISVFVLALLAGCDKIVDPTKSAPTAADTARTSLQDTSSPVPRPNTPIILPDSLLDTTGLHLANAELLHVDSGIDYATLTIQTSHPGVRIGLLMRSHEKWLPTGGCRTDTSIDLLDGGTSTPIHPTLCWDGIKIVPQAILIVGFDDPTVAYAQVVTTLKVAVPWSSLDSFVDFLDRGGDTLSVQH